MSKSKKFLLTFCIYSSSNNSLVFTERSSFVRYYIVLHYNLEKVSLFFLRITQKPLQLPVFSFFLFLFPSVAFRRTGKSFLSVFDLSLPKTRVTNVWPVSLYALANISLVICSLLLEMRVTHDVR